MSIVQIIQYVEIEGSDFSNYCTVEKYNITHHNSYTVSISHDRLYQQYYSHPSCTLHCLNKLLWTKKKEKLELKKIFLNELEDDFRYITQ